MWKIFNQIFIIVFISISLGVNCETKCPPGLYGDDCENVCRCYNNSSCDAQTGKCICNKGWRGETCTDPCPEGYYGLGNTFSFVQ